MRCFRVSELIKRHVSKIIGDVFPSLRNVMLTVTRVTVSKDLRNATIFYRTIDSADLSNILNDKHAISIVRSSIGKDLNLKFTPNVIFEEDKMIFDEYVDVNA